MIFLKKLRKNKFLVLLICVIVVSFVYFGAQKAIDNYTFNTNGDIVSEVDGANGETAEDLEDNGSSGKDVDSKEWDDKILNEETDLVMEETEGEVNSEDGVGEDVDASLESEKNEEEIIEQDKIYVYITGEVNSPGVVILNEGSRIVDAINAAGGTTIKANISKVNLVYVLSDGMKINIPNDNDLKNNSDFEYITMNSGDGGNDDYSSSSGDSLAESSSSGGNSSSLGSHKGYSIININTATQTELETLPGIGPSLALKIINYRKENGKFSSIDEIKNVSGIGESKFEELKVYITV